MIESNQSICDLPYRARIMMTANIDNQKSASCTILNTKINSSNLQNLKPMNSKLTSKLNNNYTYSSGDLQPLQWLQQDTILSIIPLDNEEEFVPGKDDITSITTSPVKIDVVSESKSEDSMSQNSTIADYYRYQAMRAAMANGHQNGTYRQHGYLSYTNSLGVRPNNSGSQHNLCHSVNEFQKPPFSYTHIIFMAIETSPNKAMTVNDIYVWCETHFPYYTQAGVGWKNSLRHNLSINKSFKKISRDGRGGPGRGAYWVVEPRERNNLIDAIRRSPCSLGSFPFLNNTYPWSSTTCYSNNFFHSGNTLNTNHLATLAATRSIINNKLNSFSDFQVSSARGPLLRIGGQLTDASNLIRSTPVIQRLNPDSGSNIIDLSKSSSSSGSNLISNTITLPLIQFDQIKFDSDLIVQGTLNESTYSNDMYSSQPQQPDEEDCRGKVFVLEDPIDLNPELYQTYIDIVRGLIYNEMEKSKSTRSDSIRDCPIHTKLKKQSTNNKSSNGKSTGASEAVVPSEEGAMSSKEGFKKQCSIKQRKRCICNKYNDVSESDESESWMLRKEFSELSDTGFNGRITTGLLNQHKEKKRICSKLKSSSSRKTSYNRNRINNITRAPHPDHVYAILQEFLTPANNSENQSPITQNIDDKESFSSVLADDKSVSIDLSQSSLSKRSKHKLQFQRKSMKQFHYSDSDSDCFNETNYENFSKNLLQNNHSSITSTKSKSIKSGFPTKMIKNNSRLLKENSDLINNKMYQKHNYDYDDEERENRYYDKNEDHETSVSVHDLYKSVKIEKCDYEAPEIEPTENGKSSNYNYSFLHFKRVRLNKSDQSVKRKVGRPKKSECYSINSRFSSDHRIAKNKLSTNKLKKKLKSSKTELKYLKEYNSNKSVDTEIINKDEQVAINILANLQRKNQQERIQNMYNLSNFIQLHHSDSNMS